MDKKTRAKAVELGARRAIARMASAFVGLALDLARVVTERIPSAVLAFGWIGMPLIGLAMAAEPASVKMSHIGFFRSLWEEVWKGIGLSTPGTQATTEMAWGAIFLIALPLEIIGAWMLLSDFLERKNQGGSSIPFVTMPEVSLWAMNKGLKMNFSPIVSPVGLGKAIERWKNAPKTTWSALKADTLQMAYWPGLLLDLVLGWLAEMIVASQWMALFACAMETIFPGGRSNHGEIGEVARMALVGAGAETLFVTAFIARISKTKREAIAGGKVTWRAFLSGPIEKAPASSIEKFAKMGEGNLARWEAREIHKEASEAVGGSKAEKGATEEAGAQKTNRRL